MEAAAPAPRPGPGREWRHPLSLAEDAPAWPACGHRVRGARSGACREAQGAPAVPGAPSPAAGRPRSAGQRAPDPGPAAAHLGWPLPTCSGARGGKAPSGGTSKAGACRIRAAESPSARGLGPGAGAGRPRARREQVAVAFQALGAFSKSSLDWSCCIVQTTLK
ncbi:non-homologous end joining protein Ku-like [Dipodomys merriami]|uniref:non-homologous end joining protein Ku-like n=1 Tax=Dipodomys merriami TaxID=94247 RepID=UPI003855713E